MHYAVTDIETTGGSLAYGKITEIAIYIFDGEKIIDRYETLINPEIRIPYAIQQLTGISNEMVAGAPRFFEVAKKIVEITEGCIFVAHNVGFDYGFIKSEFKSLGFDWQREKICTVKLSRKLLPGHPTYSLGKLCKALGIGLKNHHRAGGDAAATVELLKLCMAAEGSERYLEGQGLSPIGLNPLLDPSIVKKLPDGTGVYYFLDENRQIIYVGKSKNIRSRIMAHFNNSTTKKAMEMKFRIVDIKFELTGSELVALLKESDEIKKIKPYYNRAQRRSHFSSGLFATFDQEGYVRFEIGKSSSSEVPIASFTSNESARNYLLNVVQEFQLCQKLTGLYKTSSSCFQYNLKQCQGACIGKENAEEYNKRAQNAIQSMGYHCKNMILIDEGRNLKEKAIVAIENGRYIGFGFVDKKLKESEFTKLKERVTPFSDNRDVQQIIKGYIRRKEVAKILTF